MMTRRRRTTTDDEPATAPAVVPPPVEPRADWSDWSADRERRRLAFEMAEKAKADEPIYPVELARRLAEDWRTMAPDWRAMRPSLSAYWGRLLRAQPELDPKITQQREALLNAVFTSLPRHLRGLTADLHTLIDLLLTGHECAAYLVGFEAGKLAANRTPAPCRPRIPRKVTPSGGGLRLTIDD